MACADLAVTFYSEHLASMGQDELQSQKKQCVVRQYNLQSNASLNIGAMIGSRSSRLMQRAPPSLVQLGCGCRHLPGQICRGKRARALEQAFIKDAAAHIAHKHILPACHAHTTAH